MKRLTFCVLVAALSQAQEMPKPVLPDGLRGFAGILAGNIVEKYDGGLLLEVDEVKAGKKNEAKRPESAVGQRLLINLAWEKNGQGGWRMVPHQVAWLARVETGSRAALAVANDEGERLHIRELTEEQRQLAEKAETRRTEGALPEPAIPEGLQGFSGRLAGEVVQVGELGFVLRVADVVKIWRKNTARDPQSAVGRDLLVNVQWVARDGGRWEPSGPHVRWVATLEVGAPIEVEVVNDEGQRLHILELSEEQRRAAEGDR